MQRARRTPLSESRQPDGSTEPADEQSAGSDVPTLAEDGPGQEADAAAGGDGRAETGDDVEAGAGGDSGGSGAGRPRRTPLLFAGVAAIALALDQLTKAIVLANLRPGDPVDVIGTLLRFNLVKNPGAAFSLGTGYTVVLTVVAVGVAAVVIHLSRRLRSRGWTIAFGLLLGGALGNLCDRFFREPAPLRGHVVDFLQLPHWAIFNLADTAIVTAACLMVLQTLRGVGLDGGRDQRAR